MNIPPLLSRTPPPLCDDNDDGEFGNFVMCNDMGGEAYDDYQNVGKIAGVEDSASEDSGLCTGSSMGQAHSPYETSPTTGHKSLHNGEDHSFESLPLSDIAHGHRQSLHHTMCDDSIIIGEMDVESHIEVEQVETIIPNNIEEINNGHIVIQSTDSVTLDGLNEEKSISSTSTEILSNHSITLPNSVNSSCIAKLENFIEDEDCEFEKFQEFDSLDKNQFQKTANDASISGCSYVCQNETNLAEEKLTKKINNNTVRNEWDQSSRHLPADCCTAADEDIIDDADEFSDFQTSSFPPKINAEQIDHSSLHLFQDHFTAVLGDESGEFKEISAVQLNFSTEGIPTLLELVHNNSVWSHLYSLDETPAFRYQWASSLTNRKLLSALKIDSRNILSSLWSKSVKMGSLDGSSIDQSNLGSDIVKDTSKNHSATLPKNIVPDAHFDWDGSGLTNPLDCGSNTLLDLPHLSFTCASKNILAERTETFHPFHSSADNSCVSSVVEFGLEPIKISQQAEEILSTLPNRSYLKKTYIVFKKTP